jgi:sugar lactone lactonase YvrE
MTWHTATPAPNDLGESPFWHPAEARLYWIDIPARLLMRMDPLSRQIDSWAMAEEPGCIAPAHGGGLVVALRSGMYRAPVWGGALSLIVAAPYDTATMRFNDGKADPLGRFWSGTIHEPRDAKAAQLWSLDCRGPAPLLHSKAGEATTGNGLAWSPDARTLYWSDTPGHTIRAWDWDAVSNTLSRPRVFASWPGKPAHWQPGMPGNGGYGGRPDGAAVDAEGNYWVAMFEGGRVLQLSPGGELLSEWPLPALCPTMPCFGGADLKTLYVTTASLNRPPAELAALPDSGCVFAMQVQVAGLPVNLFDGGPVVR